MGFGYLAVLNDKSVPLAAGVAKDGGTVEGQVEGAGELAVRIGEEANTRLAGGVEGCAPGAHAGIRVSNVARRCVCKFLVA